MYIQLYYSFPLSIKKHFGIILLYVIQTLGNAQTKQTKLNNKLKKNNDYF